MKREFPFPPYPRGWYRVADSADLAPGAVLRLEYFGRPLVGVRFESGEARVFDAHCPHLGAHLGYGGIVVGETIQCPFHAWRFGLEGQCVGIPYAKHIPPRAQLRAWPVCERNGLLMLWFAQDGRGPEWQVPELPELASPEWTEPQRLHWVVKTRQQEMAENVVDPAHFRYVHGTVTVPESEVQADGHVFRVISCSGMATPQGVVEGTIQIEAHAFGWGYTRFTGIVETLLMTTGTPIDAERVDLNLRFVVRRLANSDATRGVGAAFIAEVTRQFSQDIPIWENKIHLERPLLCDGDGPIPALRRWGRQFYDTSYDTSASSG